MLFLGIGFGISRYCFSLRCFCRDFCSYFFAVFSATRSVDLQDNSALFVVATAELLAENFSTL
jgi:hypothetical protein